MTQRRAHHKQDPNLLADWLNDKLEALEPHRTTIAVIGGAVLVLALLGMFVFTGDNPVVAQEWSDYLSAFSQQDPKNALESLATKAKNQNSPPIYYAKLALADQFAARGAQLTFSNRAEAKETLDKAVKYYKEVEAAAVSHPELQNRARLGLAGAYESLVLPDDAIKTLEQVSKNAKDTVLVKAADESLVRLKNPRTLETLAWFAKQEPAPKTSPHGGLDLGVPDRPNFPGVKPVGPAPDLPGADTAVPETPAETTPGDAKPEEPKAEEKPAEDKPADAKPADEKPAPSAEEKPASEAPPAPTK